MTRTSRISTGIVLAAAMLGLTAIPAGATDYKMTIGSSHPPVFSSVLQPGRDASSRRTATKVAARKNLVSK